MSQQSKSKHHANHTPILGVFWRVFPARASKPHYSLRVSSIDLSQIHSQQHLRRPHTKVASQQHRSIPSIFQLMCDDDHLPTLSLGSLHANCWWLIELFNDVLMCLNSFFKTLRVKEGDIQPSSIWVDHCYQFACLSCTLGILPVSLWLDPIRTSSKLFFRALKYDFIYWFEY